MHILYLCSEYPPYHHGGIGSFVQTIARALVERGHQVTVIGIYRQTTRTIESDYGVQVIRIPSSQILKIGFFINFLKLTKRIKDINKEIPIDLIDGQENAFAFLPKKAKWKNIIRMHGGHHFFYSELGYFPRPWRSYIERLSFSKADAIVAVSRYVAETTRGLLNLGDREITVIPNAVDTNLFCPRPNIIEEPGSILFVGTVTEKKGVRQLVDAMPIIRKAIPNAHLNIIGRDSVDKETGKLYTDLLRENMTKDISEFVRFIGPIPNKEVSEWIARAQVCVFPSHIEAQGIVIIEAMASGKAVVASKTGPGPEIIKDGIEGLLCDPYSPMSIAEKVITLLENEMLRKALSINARKTAVEQFSIEVIIEKDLEFYENCLQSNNC